MLMVRKHLRGFVRLALAAMLALALLPSVAHALNFLQGNSSSLAEICTPRGMQWVQLDVAASEGERPSTAVDPMEDCPYCSRAMSVDGLPPPAQQPQLLPAADGDEPPLFLRARRTPFAWASAQPRGPPQTA